MQVEIHPCAPRHGVRYIILETSALDQLSAAGYATYSMIYGPVTVLYFGIQKLRPTSAYQRFKSWHVCALSA
jgi:hypothetical protein